MKKLFIALSFVFSLMLNAQDQKLLQFSDAVEVQYKEGNSFPSFVDLGTKSDLPLAKFFDYFFQETGLNSKMSFQLINSITDDLGFKHDRYRLFINNIEVAYSNLIVHSKNGAVHSFNGNLSTTLIGAQNPSISEEIALNKALEFVDAVNYQWEIENRSNPKSSEFYPKGNLLYLPDYGGESTQLKLVFAFNIYANEPLSRQMVYVNAVDGAIEFSESLIHTGGTSVGTAVTAYSDTQTIITDSVGQVFRMRDSTRGNGIVTLNALGMRSYGGAVDFLDSNNFWNNVNSSLDQYAGDTHWGTEAVYDYLQNVHNRNSIDNMGFALISFIHYGQNYVNAFWNGQVMTYGDGNAMTSPLTTLDIVGHEITHGLTDFTSDLIYANESGALNESFSDIFGTAIEFHARPNRANWLVGEDIGGAFRSMSNPNFYGDPDCYGGLNWINQNCTPTANNDRCGVHTNSGVQNYWFYLLVNGGSGVNDLSDTFNVSGIGMNKAEKIAYRNLTVYLNPSSNYNEARFYAIKSAIDLYGACSPEVEATTNAWYAVGVGQEYINVVSADFTAIEDTAFCSAPAFVNFKSEGSNVQNFIWNFGNGQSSNNRLPSTTYLNQGSYDVQLIADGGTCGSDTITKLNYITVDSATVPCAHLLNDGQNPILSSCTGRLYDSGGFGGEYSNDEEGIVTIYIPSADYIQLDFITLAIEAGIGFNCNRDYIELYDGLDLDAPMIGRYCSNYLPPNNQIISSSNAVTVKFYSDNSATEEGFLLIWKCINSNFSPVANFSSNIDSTCTGEVNFTNLTTGGYNSVTWDFGDGSVSSEYHPQHTYYSNGTYDVTLSAANSVGSDTLVSQNKITVNKLPMPQVSNDTFCIGENAGLKVYNVSKVEWYRDTLVNSIYTLDSLTIFNLRKDTTFYVKEFSNPTVFTGSRLNNAGPGNYSNDNDYIIFDVYKPILLKNMILFSNQAGTRRLELWNNQGQLVNFKDVYVPSSALRVNINMEIYPDSNYRLSFSDRDINLYKNTSGATYPYTISNLVSIKGSNTPGEFPYFYRWQVNELACESNFTKLKATIDTSCNVVGIYEKTLDSQVSIKVQPNPFKNNVEITFHNLPENEVTIKLLNIEGKLIKTIDMNNASDVYRLDLSQLKSGIYFLNLQGASFNQSRKIIKIE